MRHQNHLTEQPLGGQAGRRGAFPVEQSDLDHPSQLRPFGSCGLRLVMVSGRFERGLCKLSSAVLVHGAMMISPAP